MKKLLAFLLIFTVLGSFLIGCKNDRATEKSASEGNEVAFNEMGNVVADASDLPDWKGKKMSLKMWFAQGTASVKRLRKATKDVVTPEIYRITGIKFDEESSFDNGGELMDAKIAKLMAANDWPDIILNTERAVLEKMIEADMVYDLTDLIPKYCPNLVSYANKPEQNNYLKSNRKDGRNYFFPAHLTSLEYAAPDLDKSLIARVANQDEPIGFVYVRDDILKMLYPNAKTQDEIDEIYMNNGRFTEEEILDVPLNSKEDFFKLLYDIKALGIKEGNREVYPFYVADGLDNWSLLTTLGNLYGYNMSKGGNNNYFTYWDRGAGQVQYMFEQDFFKNALRDYTKLVRDEIASADSLIDNRAAFEEKVNNGLYAVLYGSTLPDQNTLNNSGKPYKYRKLYINVPVNTQKFIFAKTSPVGGTVTILKNQIKEEDLPQVLRYFDFALSEAGQKLVNWGPRSAGLWTEENGKRTFVDKELEDCLVYDVANDKNIYYNLKNSAWPGYPDMGQSRYNPKIIYEIKRAPAMSNKHFSMGILKEAPRVPAISPDIWLFSEYNVEGVKKFWQARQSFEDTLKKIFIAKNDEEFELLYSAMCSIAKRNGLTKETLDEINSVYANSINVQYMENLK